MSRLLPDRTYEPMEIAFQLQEQDGGYQLVLAAHSQTRSAEREIQLPDCAAAQQTAALLAALTLDPEAAGPLAQISPEQSDAPVSETDSETDSNTQATQDAPAPDEQVTALPARTSSARPAATRKPVGRPAAVQPATSARDGALQLELTPRLIGDLALLPRASVGASVGIGLRAPSYSVALVGSHLLRAEERLSGHATARAGASLWSGAVEACASVQLTSAVSVAPCLAGELGALLAQSTGVQRPKDDRMLWSAAHAGVRLELTLGSQISLLGYGGGVFPFRRAVLAFRDLGTAHTVPAASPRLWLGIGWRPLR